MLQARGRAARRGRAVVVALLGLALVLLDSTAAGAKRGRGKGKARANEDAAGAGGEGTQAHGGAGQQGIRAEDVWEWHDQFCGAALVEKNTGNLDQAVQLLGSLISQVPNVTATWLELGAIFGSAGDVQLASRCLRTVKRLDRREIKASAALRDLRVRGRLPPVVPSIDLGGDAADPAAEHQSRYKRKLYERYYHLDCRMRRLQQTLNLRPRDVSALLGSAEVSSELLYHNEAVDMLERALAVEPANGPVFVKLVEAQVKGCVFSNWDENFQRLESFILSQAAAGKPVVLGPIQSTMYPLGPKVGLAICKQGGEQAEAAVRSHARNTRLPHPTALAPPADSGSASAGLLGSLWGSVGANGGVGGGGRLTVGYVTSHFTSSSIGREMLFLLGSHLATAVATRCYALNADDGSWLQHTWRTNIAQACGKFEDVSGLDDEAAAATINRDQVHVLIDLNGWSGGNRVHLITRRPAPIQVNYKNWVASAGIPALEYNIGDSIVSPPELQEDYTESMVLVANSYFISGHRYQYLLDHRVQRASEVEASRAERAAAREEHGLPRDPFIVANFNNLDKLEPRLWKEWVGLLRRHPQATLWIQKYPPAKAARVYEMAKEGGEVDMSRLVMTGFFKSDHHIGIKALADVFIDNPSYNAHSTAMDTLWGALPFVSLPEEKMAARVGASLLVALHASWGVVRTLADMSAVVQRLIKRPKYLRRLRLAMQNARHSAPLFDTVRAVRNLETSLRLMWEGHVAEVSGRGERRRPHIIAGDVGPISATQAWLASGHTPRENAERDALEAKLHAMRVETKDAEKV